MKSNIAFISSMSLIIVGTSIGGGILGLPLETGLAGLVPSFFCFLFICLAMTISGWIVFYRFIKSRGTINNFAMLYHAELGPWAKHLNTFAYFFTFYGLLVAYLSGASTTIISIFPQLHNIPYAGKLITAIFFLSVTSIIVFGSHVIRKSNTLFSVLLFTFFIMLILLTVGHTNPANLEYRNWSYAPFVLPILATAFGYHIVIPVIYDHAIGKNLKTRNYFSILLIATIIVFLFNLIWTTIVMGILPIHSSDNISITSALARGVPATIPIAKLLHSKILILVSVFFTFFAITTSYIGVGAGLLNYIEGVTYYYFKSSRLINISITFLVPFLVALIYPDVFIKLLNIVGGIGVIISCGMLPALLGLKKDNPPYLKCLSLITMLVCIIVFVIECKILLF